jgi:hypothetical protein
MSPDPKVTDTLIYGERLCTEQRTFKSVVWNDDWIVFGDQRGHWHVERAECLAVQFRRRPVRKRHVKLPTAGDVRELEDA